MQEKARSGQGHQGNITGMKSKDGKDETIH